MKQLCQQLRDGTMEVLGVVLSLVGHGMVVLKNHFSLISAGTDGGTVNAARKILIGKARERPEQFKQVIDSVKQQGVVKPYRAVSTKLDSYSSLGYRAHGPAMPSAAAEWLAGLTGITPGLSGPAPATVCPRCRLGSWQGCT